VESEHHFLARTMAKFDLPPPTLSGRPHLGIAAVIVMEEAPSTMTDWLIWAIVWLDSNGITLDSPGVATRSPMACLS
jgi:hypothetical protein